MAKKKIKSIDFIDALHENFEEALIDYSEDEAEPITAIPTGAVSLDVSLGTGGIPLRRFSEIYGPESAGKTTLALSIAKNAIQLGYRVLYNDPEQGLDLDRAEALIGKDALDKNKFVLVQPELMEQALHICEMAIQDGSFNLIILDSIASMTPKKVKDDALTDANIALLARGFGTFLNRNSFDLRYKDIAFVGLNQIRDKFGGYFTSIDVPGGHNWKHKLSVRIQLNRVEDIKIGDVPVGILTKFVVKKNKLAPPYRSYTIPIMFDKGIDYYRDLVEFATTLGVLQKASPYYTFDGKTLASGMVNTMKYLEENPETLDKIVKACYTGIIADILEEENIDE